MEGRYTHAQERARKYPKTFEAPTQKEISALESGHFVKVCAKAAGERF